MKAVVMDLLRQYLKVEIQFQNGEGLKSNCPLLNVLILSTRWSSFTMSSSVTLQFPFASISKALTRWLVNRTLRQVCVRAA